MAVWALIFGVHICLYLLVGVTIKSRKYPIVTTNIRAITTALKPLVTLDEALIEGEDNDDVWAIIPLPFLGD